MDTNFKRAFLIDAYLEEARLGMANFEKAKLNNAFFENAELCMANFDSADVRGATGIIFHANPTQRMFIEGDAPDPWSVLRRTYTGPWFFFHIVFLIFFMLPFVAQALFLTNEAEMIVRVESFMEKTSSKLDEKQAKLLNPIKERWGSIYEKWESMPKIRAFWILFGFTHWRFLNIVFFCFTCAMVLYNALRAYLTFKVSMIRDTEERTHNSPARYEYYGIFELKRIAHIFPKQVIENLLKFRVLVKTYDMFGHEIGIGSYANLYQIHLFTSCTFQESIKR